MIDPQALQDGFNELVHELLSVMAWSGIEETERCFQVGRCGDLDISLIPFYQVHG